MNKIITIGIVSALSLSTALPVFAAGTTTLKSTPIVSPVIHTTYVSPTVASTNSGTTTRKTLPKLLQGTAKLTSASTLVITVSGVDYTVSVSNSTIVLNRLRKAAKLTDFNTGDTVRVYGVITGTVITAQIVRDTTTPVVVNTSTNIKHTTSTTTTITTQATFASPLGDLSSFRIIAQDTLNKLNTGDQSGATKRITDLESAWDQADPVLKAKNGTEWTKIDKKIDTVLHELRAVSPNLINEKVALQVLLGVLN